MLNKYFSTSNVEDTKRRKANERERRSRRAHLRTRKLSGVENLERRNLMTAAFGDFNGDGFDDLAVGVPGEDVGSLADAGAVNVLYGSSNGVSTSGDQLWYQDVGGVSGVSEAGDRFGESLAVGDFNDDGFDDLAIGVPGEAVGRTIEAGAVAVLYGSPNGLRSSASGTTLNDQLWHQNSPGLFDRPERFDRFGSALTSGDFNDDGFEDLAIGIPGENLYGRSDVGAVQILFGSATGLSDGKWLTQATGTKTSSPEAYDFFGTALASGDFDNDGFDDLAVGAPGEDFNDEAIDAGAVNIFYGDQYGLSGNTFIMQGSVIGLQPVADAKEDFDLFGSSLAVGDLNGDGFDDLAIGVPGEDTADKRVDVGAVNIIMSQMTASGPIGLANGSQIWTQDSSGIAEVSEEHDLFGHALAIGDFDGDGDNDLAVGVPGKDIKTPNLVPDAGGVHIIESAGNSGLSSAGDIFISQETPGINGASGAGDAFGAWLAAGMLDGNSRADLAVSVPGENGDAADAGGIAVLRGANSSNTFDANTDQLITQKTPGVNGAAEAGDMLGGPMPTMLLENGLLAPRFESNPGASTTLYLDFDGHQDSFLGLPISSHAFDLDHNRGTYSPTELALMQDAWDTMAEDYAAFDINVTTVSSGNLATEQRVVFGGRWQDNEMTESYVHEQAASGVSPPGAFTLPTFSNTAYVFTASILSWNEQQTGSVIGNVGSHEAGHAFGILHKSDFSASVEDQMFNEYSSGGPDWTPIMGNSFAPGRAIWTRSAMDHPTDPKLTINGNDDVQILTDVLGLRSDDHADGLNGATYMGSLDTQPDFLINQGIIETTADMDTFVFTVGASGAFRAEVIVNDVAANLDSILVIGNAETGQILNSLGDSSSLGAVLYQNVLPGSYFAQVRSQKEFNGDIGQFTIRVDLQQAVYVGRPPIVSRTTDHLSLTDSSLIQSTATNDSLTITDDRDVEVSRYSTDSPVLGGAVDEQTKKRSGDGANKDEESLSSFEKRSLLQRNLTDSLRKYEVAADEVFADLGKRM